MAEKSIITSKIHFKVEKGSKVPPRIIENGRKPRKIPPKSALKSKKALDPPPGPSQKPENHENHEK
jgi:hypothetical protein